MSKEESELYTALVESARGGDAAAFAQLYEGCRERLYRTAMTVLRNPQDAEDAVMDAVGDAFSSISSLREPELFEGWLFTILYNKARRLAGRQKRAQGLPLIDEVVPDSGEQPTDALTERADLQAALSRLDEQERAIVALCVCQGYKSAEAGKILGINPATVRSKQMRALAKLKTMMQGNYNG